MTEILVFSEDTLKPNTLIPEDQVTGVSRSARSVVSFELIIEGVSLKEKGLDDYVRKIMVDEHLNVENTLEVHIVNPDYNLQNSELFKAGNEIEVYLGWVDTGVVSHGKYILTTPELRYPKHGVAYIKLVGNNKAVLLSQYGQKRRSFEKKKDSEIAQIIATEYGLQTDIKDTEDKFDIVIQANETDLAFLLRRAELYGYILYVDDNTLHYHPVRFTDTGRKIGFRVSTGDNVNFDNVNLKTTTFLQALEVHKQQVHWETLDIYAEHSNEEEDSLYKAAKDSGTIKYAKEIVGLSPQATWYLVGEGHIQSIDELRRQTEAFSKSSRWIVEVTGSTLGVEIMEAGKILRIENMDEYDGAYLIRDCRHVYNAIKSGFSYTTVYVLQRTFNRIIKEDINLAQDSKPIDITSGLESEGFIGTT